MDEDNLEKIMKINGSNNNPDNLEELLIIERPEKQEPKELEELLKRDNSNKFVRNLIGGIITTISLLYIAEGIYTKKYSINQEVISNSLNNPITQIELIDNSELTENFSSINTDYKDSDLINTLKFDGQKLLIMNQNGIIIDDILVTYNYNIKDAKFANIDNDSNIEIITISNNNLYNSAELIIYEVEGEKHNPKPRNKGYITKKGEFKSLINYNILGDYAKEVIILRKDMNNANFILALDGKQLENAQLSYKAQIWEKKIPSENFNDLKIEGNKICAYSTKNNKKFYVDFQGNKIN